jgi:hypothetical protein
VLYCSEKCRQEAYENYHKYLCGIENGLQESESCFLKLFCIGLNCFDNPDQFAEFLRETDDSNATGWDVDYRGMDEKEINKNLFLVMNSFKEKFTSRPQSEWIMLYKKFAWITATALNISKLKDVLVTEDHKAMLRNFVFRHSKFTNHYYLVVCNLVRQKPYFEDVCIGVLSLTNFFNNSCVPNVKPFYDDSKVKFITLRPIKKGEQLFIPGVREFWQDTVEDRKAIAWKKHGFICKCEACEQPEKYPLENDFQSKDRGAYCHSIQTNPRMKNDFIKLFTQYDVDVAVREFRRACEYLDTHDKDFPSYEGALVDGIMSKCIFVFTAYDDLS